MFGLHVDKNSEASMMQQLTGQIRQMVLKGEMNPGERLPPSRELARDLHVARNTIIQVYEQLVAEGYLESRTGSGTFVTDLTQFHPPGRFVNQEKTEAVFEPAGSGSAAISFHSGNPDTHRFPVTQWARLMKEACLDAPASRFEYGPAAGDWQLRSAISRYVFRSKGISCEAGQVLITPGTARGIELLARVLYKDGASAAVEDPCNDFIPAILGQCGLQVLPVPTDRHGMQTEKIPMDSSLRFIYIVPSHQFPTGGVLPIGRRLQLLKHAREMDAYVIEDDYDSEFRYQGEPIQSLRHLDPERVVYLGTFSKIFTPAIRLGYMIVPVHLQKRLALFMEQINLRTSALEQAAMSAFIDNKLLDRHVYGMKKSYERKRRHIIDSLLDAFGSKVAITGENAGLHVLVAFQDIEFRAADFLEFRKNGIEVDWVEDYAMLKGTHKNQLVLGYGNLSMDQISEGVHRLKKALDILQDGRAQQEEREI